MLTAPGRVPLGRRAWIGDGQRGASLAPDGTVDWFASGGLTAAPDLWRLLDESGPAVRVGPLRDGSGATGRLPDTTMAYRPGTNVVETLAEGSGARRISVVDFMPWPPTGGGAVVRLVRALSGPVDVEVEVLAGPPRRPGGGRRAVVPSGAGLLLDGLLVSSPAVFAPAPLGRDVERWRAVVRLEAGEEAVVTLGLDHPLGPGAARRLLGDTEAAWRSWLAPLAYTGRYLPAVQRALLAVKSLTGPGGAPAAAGTTSLPRRVGSERAADDRWVRLRDVASAVETLAACGLAEDAEHAEAWLRRTLTTAHVPWPAWFDADGQPVPEMQELPFTGWRRSQPVVDGRPHPTPDPGLAGIVASVVGGSMRGPGGRRADPGPLSAAFDALAEETDWAADHWRDPDAGVWEIGRPHRMYVAGRLAAWTAFDRMAALARRANPLDLQAAGWQQERRDLFSWMESEAIAADGGLRMDADPGGADEPDAALLRVAWTGPWPPSHPLVGATVDRALERLSSGPLIHRYADRVSDERAGPDNPDLESSLMAVRSLAALERWDEAHERMEGIAGLTGRPGPGLLFETADPVSGELLGNFPATAAGLALVGAAVSLESGPR